MKYEHRDARACLTFVEARRGGPRTRRTSQKDMP